MLIDHKIIAHHGASCVLAQRHELSWPDGSAVQIHPVWAHSAPLTFFRALPDNGRLLVFDVTRLAPELDADMRSSPPRDQVGLVFFAMRRHFRTADELRGAVRAIGTPVAACDNAHPLQHREAA